MFPRNQTQTTREAASLKGLSNVVWCTRVSGAGSLAYGQVSTIIGSSSKRFAHQSGLSFGFNALDARLPIRLAMRLGNPEDRP